MKKKISKLIIIKQQQKNRIINAIRFNRSVNLL